MVVNMQNMTIHIPIEDHDESIIAQKKLLLQKFNVDHENQPIPAKNLQKSGNNDNDESSSSESSLLLPEDLLCALRICHMTDVELYFFEADKLNPKKSQISAYNEMRSCLFLKRTISAALTNVKKDKSNNDNNDSNDQEQTLQSFYDTLVSYYTKLVKQNEPTHQILDSHSDSGGEEHDDEERLKRFLAWAQEHGVEHSSVSVANFEHFGKGLAATRDLSNDETVITISRKMLLCVKTALESETVGKIFERLRDELQLDEDSLITLFFMYEHGSEDTKWRPYFDILPETLPTYPLYFSEDALDKLQGTPLFIEVMQTKEQLRTFYDTVFPVLFEHFPQVFKREVFTYERLVWTRAIFDTRAFSFRDMGCCLLPFVDFVNTYPYPQLESKGWYITETDAFHLKTFANVKKGDQLFICYGPYSNRELLQHYGFMTQDNPYDRYYIDFELPEHDSEKVKEQKMSLLKKFHLSLDHFFRRGPIPSKMIAALRIALMNEQEVKRAMKGGKWSPFTRKSNDDIVCQTLKSTLEALIDMLNMDASTAAADSNLTEIEKIALQYKASQHNVLAVSLQNVEKQLQ